MTAVTETGGTAIDSDADARRINELVTHAESHARCALQAALEAGTILLSVKQRLEHGEFQKWVTAHCTIAPRTASAYMRLARQYPALDEPNRQRVADLPLREAVRAIGAAPESLPAVPRVRVSERAPRERVLKKFAAAKRSITVTADLLRGAAVSAKQIAVLRGTLEALIQELDALAVSEVEQ